MGSQSSRGSLGRTGSGKVEQEEQTYPETDAVIEVEASAISSSRNGHNTNDGALTTRHNDNVPVNTEFKWPFGGETVYLTGTFTFWRDHIPMQRNGDEFTTILKLPRGVYQYKFIVDGDWQHSPDDPTTSDPCGNINNILDTTGFQPAFLQTQEIAQKPRSPIPKLKTKQTNEELPTLDLNDEAPQLPVNYVYPEHLEEYELRSKVYTLRDEQLTELERQYKALQSRFLRGVVERRNSLEPPTHVAVNHTSTRLPDDVSEHPEWRLNSVTHRFHDKYVTLKFYKCVHKP
eukprot:TRINITY_DN12358_c0_g1_i3.p1 TRINITY_DN12358_c0_g1~~TRINITY_DN12358_c0_g1_i3.p1  ORF type:complete len:289 (-),score=43.03 TRINITY_DN12358_c0_g1_i3:36-902(-)